MRWRNTRTRRSRRNGSPIRRTTRSTNRPSASASTATHEVQRRRLVEGGARCRPRRPVSMPSPHQRGPGEQARGLEQRARDASAIGSRYGRSMPPQPAQDLLRLRRGRASIVLVPTGPPSTHPPLMTPRTSLRLGLGRRGCARRVREHVAVPVGGLRAARRACLRRRHDPSSSSTTRSASAIVAGRWAMMIVVRPVHHLAERGADLVLLGRVDRRRRVVEDQHPRVGEHRAGDRDALALPAGEREPVLADHGVVAVGKVVDEVGSAPASRAARRTCSIVALGIGERDVLAHRVGEEERVLEHDADLACAGRAPARSRTSTPSRSTRPSSTS